MFCSPDPAPTRARWLPAHTRDAHSRRLNTQDRRQPKACPQPDPAQCAAPRSAHRTRPRNAYGFGDRLIVASPIEARAETTRKQLKAVPIGSTRAMTVTRSSGPPAWARPVPTARQHASRTRAGVRTYPGPVSPALFAQLSHLWAQATGRSPMGPVVVSLRVHASVQLPLRGCRVRDRLWLRTRGVLSLLNVQEDFRRRGYGERFRRSSLYSIPERARATADIPAGRGNSQNVLRCLWVEPLRRGLARLRPCERSPSGNQFAVRDVAAEPWLYPLGRTVGDAPGGRTSPDVLVPVRGALLNSRPGERP